MRSQTDIEVQLGESRGLERNQQTALELSPTCRKTFVRKAGGPDDLVMRAIIIYDDFFGAVKAKAALQNSAKNPGFAARWDLKPWRLDLLKSPTTAEEALTEARDAHLIVFAGRTAQSIPCWLETWLEHWVKCRQVEEAAIAVVGVDDESLVSSFGAPDLEDFARRHNLNFIFREAGEFEARPTITAGLQYDSKLADFTNMQLAAGVAQRGLIRAWGINE